MYYAVLMTVGLCWGFQDKLPKDSMDRRALLGTWKAVRGEVDGKSIAQEFLEKMTLSFSEKECVGMGPTSERQAYRYELDSSMKPKQITLTVIDEGDQKGKTTLGIYSLEKDLLTICYADFGGKRPAEFKTEKLSGRILVVLTRTTRQ